MKCFEIFYSVSRLSAPSKAVVLSHYLPIEVGTKIPQGGFPAGFDNSIIAYDIWGLRGSMLVCIEHYHGQDQTHSIEEINIRVV